MNRLDVAQVLNVRFNCTGCELSGRWTLVTKPLHRQNSSIHRLRCARCGEQIVAKASSADGSGNGARAEARREYETLYTLQGVFPQDERYGTLMPLGYLEASGHGIMVTRYCPGVDLARYQRSVGEHLVQRACHEAGVWLRKLHESGQPAGPPRALGVSDKLDYLAGSYGAVLRRDRTAWAAYRHLEDAASSIHAREFRTVRHHGDFKAQNMLCDGTRYIGLDIHWQTSGPAIYDLAPFLNHLWLASRTQWDTSKSRHYRRRESMFLAGYGDADDTEAVHWARLYFALCHLGSYRQRGPLQASYAHWKIRPLVQELASQPGKPPEPK